MRHLIEALETRPERFMETLVKAFCEDNPAMVAEMSKVRGHADILAFPTFVKAIGADEARAWMVERTPDGISLEAPDAYSVLRPMTREDRLRMTSKEDRVIEDAFWWQRILLKPTKAGVEIIATYGADGFYDQSKTFRTVLWRDVLEYHAEDLGSVVEDAASWLSRQLRRESQAMRS